MTVIQNAGNIAVGAVGVFLIAVVTVVGLGIAALWVALLGSWLFG